MSTTLILEVEKNINFVELKRVLSAIKISNVSISENRFEACFHETNVWLTAKTNLADSTVCAEELGEVKWEVGMRVFFNIDPTISNALVDIKTFIFYLFETTSYEFVLSFQYETLYARTLDGKLILSESMSS